jgi:2-succinyl-6-hydroxy-2,4-cyclohexadiene-1-carboxylate synthase
MGRGSDWQDLATDLSKDYYCLLLDLPGHGNSPIGNTKTFHDVAELIIKSIDDLEKKIDVVGYSMGGRIAFYLILKFPHLFNRAIIESASPGIKSEKDKRDRYQKDLALLKDLKSKEEMISFLKKWYTNPLFGKISKTTLIEKKSANNPQILNKAQALLSVGNQPSLWKELENLKIPTLYLSGQRDEKYTKIGNEIAKLSPLIITYVFKDCAHITHLENPDKFRLEIESFLSK